MRKSIKITLGTAGAFTALCIGLTSCGSHASVVSVPPATHSAPAAPASKAPAKKAASTYNLPVGSKVQVTDGDTNSSYLVTVNSINSYSPGEYDNPAPGGMHYIVANVTYKVLTGHASPNEFDWESKDANGQTHDSQFLGADNGALSSNNVSAGNLVTGNVYLEVPDNSKYGNTIVYSPGLSEVGSWTIPSYLG